MNVAFLDRDGTLINEPPDGLVLPNAVEILPGVIDGLHGLMEQGFALVIVSNQASGPSQRIREDMFRKTEDIIERRLGQHGIRFTHVFMCPHTDTDRCSCKKPKTGMVDDFLQKNPVDRAASFMTGDRDTDAQFARSIGVRFIPMERNGRFPTV